jgi:hypothetical protein
MHCSTRFIFLSKPLHIKNKQIKGNRKIKREFEEKPIKSTFLLHRFAVLLSGSKPLSVWVGCDGIHE